MPEMLRGDISQVPLPDVLRLLVSSRQTGRLDLLDGARTGAVYLENGTLIHAVHGAQMGEAAVFSLIAWQEGGFSFVPNQVAPEESISISTDELLKEGTRKAREWAEIMRALPGIDAVFRLSPSGSPSGVSLEPNEWQVLAQIDGVRDVSEIADALGWDEFDVATVLVRLVTGGLLDCEQGIESDLAPTLDSIFLKRLDAEFLDIVGPLGPAIIDDEIAGMRETKESFPVARAAELIERISADIADDEKRTGFQRIMLNVLRSL